MRKEDREIIEKLDNLLKVMGASSYDNFFSPGPKGHFKTILEKLETLQPSTRSSSFSSSDITDIIKKALGVNTNNYSNTNPSPTIFKYCQDTYSVVSQTYKKIETLTDSTNNILLKLTNSFLPSIKNTVEQQSQIVQKQLGDQHNQLTQLGARVQKGLTREDFEAQLDDLSEALQKQLKPLGQLEALPRKVEGFLTPKFEALERILQEELGLIHSVLSTTVNLSELTDQQLNIYEKGYENGTLQTIKTLALLFDLDHLSTASQETEQRLFLFLLQKGVQSDRILKKGHTIDILTNNIAWIEKVTEGINGFGRYTVIRSAFYVQNKLFQSARVEKVELSSIEKGDKIAT